ncbi:hypothetical protein GYB59_13570 [bacterium]|nr:hypothetical protein [bacterium]
MTKSSSTGPTVTSASITKRKQEEIMPRDVPKSKPARRSQRWMQFFANERRDLLNDLIYQSTGIPTNDSIEWRSPLADDDFAEYFDQAFLDRLGVSPLEKPLNQFWPNGGPHWDGLAITQSGEVILVEAKANIVEFATDPSAAGEESKPAILDSLGEVQQFMRIGEKRRRPELWFNAFYQYANRIAHLYYLRELNGIPTHLICLDIINDPDSGEDAVKSADEWKSLVRLAEACLGISRTKRLMKHVHHIHVDVKEMSGLPECKETA